MDAHNPYDAKSFQTIFLIYLNLELILQFPASNDEKYDQKRTSQLYLL